MTNEITERERGLGKRKMKVGMKLQREKGLEKIKGPCRGKDEESCSFIGERRERENEKFVSSHKSPS